MQSTKRYRLSGEERCMSFFDTFILCVKSWKDFFNEML